MAKKDSDELSDLKDQPREQSEQPPATIETDDGEQRLDVDVGADVLHQLPDAAARLDVFRDGTVEGLADAAKETTGEVPGGTPTDQLGNPIARHDGPGIADMYKDANKHGVETGGSPEDQILHAGPAATGPEMPPTEDPQRDPSLVSADDGRQGLLPNLFGGGGKSGPSADDQLLKRMQDMGAVKPQVDKILKDSGVWEADKKAQDLANPKDGGTKYSDPDYVGGTSSPGTATPIDEAPAGPHDLLGHRVNPLDGPDDSQQPELDDKTIQGVVKAHSGLPPDQILTDPDQVPTSEAQGFDPANPLVRPGDELMNTGNPNDPRNTEPHPHTFTGGASGGGSDPNPHTDGGDDDGGGGKGPVVLGGPGDSGTSVLGGGQHPVVGGGATGSDTQGSVAMDQDAATAAPSADTGDAAMDTGAAPGAAVDTGATIDQPVDAPSVDTGAASIDSPSLDTGSDFDGPPQGADAQADPGGTDYDDDLAEGGPVPDVG